MKSVLKEAELPLTRNGDVLKEAELPHPTQLRPVCS